MTESATNPATVSVVIITMNRHEELIATIENVLSQDYPSMEIIIFDNGSRADILELNREAIARFPQVRFIENDTNLGVAGGRNAAADFATGEYLLELDDDAVFDSDTAISTAVKTLQEKQPEGYRLLAFRIVNYHSREIVPAEYPFRDKASDPMKSRECAWFIGAGHLIDRSLIEEIGLYREFFPWGSEEQDFALRTLKQGYRIWFASEVLVYHKKAMGGRILNPRTFGAIALKNRVKVAALNLPLVCVLSYFIVRSAQRVLLHRDPVIPFLALRHLWRERDYIRAERKPISWSRLRELRLIGAPVFF